MKVPLGAGIPASKALKDGDVCRTQEHEAVRLKPVTPGSADLLTVVFKSLRHVQMDDLDGQGQTRLSA